MKSTFVSKEKNEVVFNLEFTAEEFENEIQQAYLKTRNKFVVDGFRKGKAPRKLIEMRYGEDVFYEETINTLFSDAYPKAIEELKIESIDRPSIDFNDIEKGKDFVIIVKVTVKPEVSLGDYKGVKIDKVEYTITDDDVQKELEAMQQRNSRLVIADRPAQNGDTVWIDYSGFVGDEQFGGGTAEKQYLELGSGSFIPGFEDQLVGTKAGDEVDVKVTFPEAYHAENLAGKEAVFKVKVHEVKEKEMPEINDEFAKDVSEFDTLDELKKDTKAKLEKTAEGKADFEQKNVILKAVCDISEVDIPDVLIQEQIDEMVREFEMQLRYQGLKIEDYFKYLGKEIKDFRDELKDDAFKKVKTRLTLEAIAEKENLEVSEDEIEEELKNIAEQYKTDVEKIKKTLRAENYDYFIKDLKLKKSLDFLANNVNIA